MGVNLEGVADWTPQPFFADLIKQGRAWNVIGSLSTPAPVDANGWPTADAQIVVATPPAMVARTEPYKLSFVGNATVSALGGTIANKAYDAATNTTTADVFITASDPAQPHLNDNFFLSFSGQPGGVKQVRLLRPGHAPSEIFSRDLLARISWFSTLRLIAFLGPGNSQVTANTDREWSDRGLPGYSLQTVDAPAWEFVTLLANAAKKDVWIGIPYYASDDYITKLAQLFKYGSDGVNPYTSQQTNPVYPPLASRPEALLRVLERDLELRLPDHRPERRRLPGRGRRRRPTPPRLHSRQHAGSSAGAASAGSSSAPATSSARSSATPR